MGVLDFFTGRSREEKIGGDMHRSECEFSVESESRKEESARYAGEKGPKKSSFGGSGEKPSFWKGGEKSGKNGEYMLEWGGNPRGWKMERKTHIFGGFSRDAGLDGKKGLFLGFPKAPRLDGLLPRENSVCVTLPHSD